MPVPGTTMPLIDGSLGVIEKMLPARSATQRYEVSSVLRGSGPEVGSGRQGGLSNPACDPAHPTNADVWLQYPAQSWQRDHLRRLMKGEDENPSGGLLDSAAGLIGLG